MAGAHQIIAAAGGGKPGYRHYRINISANNGDANHSSITELELAWGSGPDITTGKSATQSSAYPGNEGVNTIDDRLDTSWATAVGGAAPSWLAIDLGAPQVATVLRIWPQSGWLARAPKNFTVQGSLDGSVWDNLASFANVTGWVAGTPKEFAL